MTYPLAVLLVFAALPAFAAGAPEGGKEKKGLKTTAEITGMAAPPKAKMQTKPAAAKPAPEDAPATGPALAASSTPVTLQYTHETVVIPGRWLMSPKTRDLLRSEYHFQWSPETMTCSGTTRWAHATISNDISPCWPPDAELFEFVKKFTMDRETASLYRRKKGAGGADAIPGGSHMITTVDINRRCYTMNFKTCEKWVNRFFPDFRFIMDNFRVNN